MKLFLTFTVLLLAIFDEFGLINANGNEAAYPTLIKLFRSKVSKADRKSKLADKLYEVLELPLEGLSDIMAGNSGNTYWVDQFKNSIDLPYVSIDEVISHVENKQQNKKLCDNLRKEMESYKTHVVDIGKEFYDINLVYAGQPKVDDIVGLRSALREYSFKVYKQPDLTQVTKYLKKIETKYKELVKLVNSIIQSSSKKREDYLQQLEKFKLEFDTLFNQQSNVDGVITYSSEQLNGIKVMFTELKQKQKTFKIELKTVYCVIQHYNEERIKFAEIVMDETLPQRQIDQSCHGLLGF